MTFAELEATWDRRDARYAVRAIDHVPHQISPAEEVAIRSWRLAEVRELPGKDLAAAVRALRDWNPPRARKVV